MDFIKSDLYECDQLGANVLKKVKFFYKNNFILQQKNQKVAVCALEKVIETSSDHMMIFAYE